MTRSLAEIAADTLIDGTARGMPPGFAPMRLDDVGRQGWSVPGEDLCLPVLTVSRSAFDHNVATINAYAAEHGLYLCAHGKTMMAPQLLARVLAGSRTVGLCAATTQQAAVMAACGARNVFIANQVVGRSNLRKLAELVDGYPEARFLVLADSLAGIEQLGRHCLPGIRSPNTLGVLVETGVAGGRAGVRDIAAGEALIAAIRKLERDGTKLELAGVSTYEGAVPPGPDAPKRTEELFNLTRSVYDLAARAGFNDRHPPIISAGGSATFDLATRAFAGHHYAVEPQIWLRPGVAPTYDHVIYQQRLAEMDARGGFVVEGKTKSAVAAFHPALAIWAVVQSIVDGDTALIAAGIRDFPADAGYPTLLEHFRASELLATHEPGSHSLHKANDQHGYLSGATALDLRVGDVLKLGISHPCTAFDKWPVLFEIDDDAIVVGAVRTYF